MEEIDMPNSAPGFTTRPDYRVDLVPESRHVKVVFGGMTIADSSAALRVEETGHGPVHYLPEKDVRLDLMRPTEHHTRCPYKAKPPTGRSRFRPVRARCEARRTPCGRTRHPMTKYRGSPGTTPSIPPGSTRSCWLERAATCT